MAQRKALGRGLSALLGTPDLEPDQLREIDIDRILPNSHQPRKNFDEDALNDRRAILVDVYRARPDRRDQRRMPGQHAEIALGAGHHDHVDRLRHQQPLRRH